MSNSGSATPVEPSGTNVAVVPQEQVADLDRLARVETPSADVFRLPVEHSDGPFGSLKHPHRGSMHLKRRLIAFDLVAIALAWSLAGLLPWMGEFNTNDRRAMGALIAAALVQFLAIVVQRLHLGRVASRRSVELAGLVRAAVAAGVTALLISDAATVEMSSARAIAGATLSFVLLSVCRGMYSSWLSTQRALGRHSRNLVLVGTNAEGLGLLELVETHPELGYRVCGVTGDESTYREQTWTVPYLGTAADTLDALASRHADGVLLASSALPPVELNGFTRELLSQDVHVHLSSGLRGFDHRRLRALPFAHEPLFYVEPSSPSVAGLRVKRGIDILVAAGVLLVASPVLIAAAIAIRLNDGGPVFFRQRRVGHHGQAFTVFKLRTMVPNAEDQLDKVLETLGNGRDNVLFKLDNDPRRTSVGRFLEATSLDELPQLVNVLNGSMSLVGPRPALPSEVEKFDDDLMRRFDVVPGITGLWQVEARDNPSFSAYRRLDLFYVENWSLTLDIVLLIETFTSVGARVIKRLRSGDRHRD